MHILRLSFLLWGLVLVSPSFAQAPETQTSIQPYIAFGGSFGEVDDCDYCKTTLGFEAALGVQVYYYLRVELFYTFSHLETDEVIGVLRGFEISAKGEGTRHTLAAMGAVALPLVKYQLGGDKIITLAPFAGVGFGHSWEEDEITGTIFAVDEDYTLEEDYSSFVFIPTAGLEAQVSLGSGNSLSLEAGYRYHYTLKDEELDRLHLGVVRLRYGF